MSKRNYDHNCIFKSIVFILILSALFGCQSSALWNTGPNFGSAVNEVVQTQLANPNAPVGNPKVTSGMDGSSAKSSVDNYQKSFEVRVPTSSGVYPAGASYGTSSGAPK